MSELIMSQAVAAEHAFRAAELAQQIADRPGVVLGFDDACRLAQTWAAVAGQFEHVAYAASSEQQWAVAGEPLPEVEPETQRIVDERLRILPTLAARRADETVVIDERPYPGRQP